MIASTGPSEFQLLDEGVAQGDQRLVLSGKSPSTQVVLAVESTPARDTAPLWRTRFGLILPGSLDALERGTVAVSPPVLLVKALTGAVDEAVADSMAAAMKSSTRVKSSDQLVVYWESYGSSSSDSIESSIRLEGQTRENALRRFGIWTGLLRERSNVVRVNWKGVTQHSQMIYDGDHPIIVNAVTLNISQLQSGTYDLQVSVRTAGGTEARAVRSIEIVK
jgi:hypothetical protein